MERASHPALPAAVNALRRRLSRWRSSQDRRRPVPEDLWREAAGLARVHGVSRIATALGLGYYGLKKRVASVTEATATAGGPAFVEIEPCFFPSGCAVEVEKGDGTKMTIRLSGSAPDLAALVDSFLGRRG